MNRHALALGALAVLVVLSGCSVFGGGGGEIDEENLLDDADYEWETNATVTYNLSVGSDEYTAVHGLENQSELSIHSERTFRGDQSVGIDALRFRFENDTVVNATHHGLNASKGSDQTTIRLPAENGTVAWTASRNGKSWSTPVFVETSHEVVLPESTRVGIPLLSRSDPRPDRTTLEDDQMTLFWEEPSGSISVRYYLVRDLYIFGGLAILTVLAGLGGLGYYFRRIRAARRQRQNVGPDVDYDDDDLDDDGPPPGMP